MYSVVILKQNECSIKNVIIQTLPANVYSILEATISVNLATEISFNCMHERTYSTKMCFVKLFFSKLKKNVNYYSVHCCNKKTLYMDYCFSRAVLDLLNLHIPSLGLYITMQLHLFSSFLIGKCQLYLTSFSYAAKLDLRIQIE